MEALLKKGTPATVGTVTEAGTAQLAPLVTRLPIGPRFSTPYQFAPDTGSTTIWLGKPAAGRVSARRARSKTDAPLADTLLYPCGSYAPCRRVEGSRARSLYPHSPCPATLCRAVPRVSGTVCGCRWPDARSARTFFAGAWREQRRSGEHPARDIARTQACSWGTLKLGRLRWWWIWSLRPA